MGWIERLRQWARRLKLELWALYLAWREPQVAWYARLLALLVVAYAFSPIDLIPDFVPLLGYLDDLILLPLGIWLAIRLIPPPVLAECRARAVALAHSQRPKNWAAAVVIVLLWLLLLWLGVRWLRFLV